MKLLVSNVCRSEHGTRLNSRTVSRPHTQVIITGIYFYLLLSYLKIAGDGNVFLNGRNKLETWKHIQEISNMLNHVSSKF